MASAERVGSNCSKARHQQTGAATSIQLCHGLLYQLEHQRHRTHVLRSGSSNCFLLMQGDQAQPLAWFAFNGVAQHLLLLCCCCCYRRLFTQYALSSRLYLGPTSMDTEMAFLMVNQAHVTRGSLVMDPYVGTGSILLAAAARGAVVLGADIDIRVLKLGKLDKKTGKHHDVYSNFQQYGLPWPAGLLRMDMHTPALRPGLCEVRGRVGWGGVGGRKIVPGAAATCMDCRMHARG